MIKEFVPYQESLELKELGFDEPCFAWYSDKNIRISGMDGCVVNKTIKNSFFTDEILTAPTFSQAFSFFRDNHKLDSAVLKDRYVIETEENLPNWYYGFKTYKESEITCLRKLISIVKQMLNQK